MGDAWLSSELHNHSKRVDVDGHVFHALFSDTLEGGGFHRCSKQVRHTGSNCVLSFTHRENGGRFFIMAISGLVILIPSQTHTGLTSSIRKYYQALCAKRLEIGLIFWYPCRYKSLQNEWGTANLLWRHAIRPTQV